MNPQNPAGGVSPTNPYDLLNQSPANDGVTNDTAELVTSPTGQEVDLAEHGRSGTLIFSGIITQEEYNKDLVRWQALKTYDEMRRSDATVRASLRAIIEPILSIVWSIQPGSDEPNDVMIADFCRQEMFDRNVVFNDFLREALLMLPFGYSVFEQINEWTDFTWTPPLVKPDFEPGIDPATGQPKVKPEPVQPPDKTMRLIGLEGLHSRKQRSIFKWVLNDGSPGITQILPGNTYQIPMDKLCIFTHEKEGDNFEGIPILRAAYQHWWIKKKLYLIDAIRIERQSLGIPKIVAPKGADQGQINDAIKIAQNLRANQASYVKTPEGWTFEFMDLMARTQVDPWPTISHHDRQILLATLTQFLELGSKGGGSKALSADHSDLFEKSIEGVCKELAVTIQKRIIKRLVDMNFPDVRHYPSIEHGKVSDNDIATLSTALAGLYTAGVLTPDPTLEQWARQAMHAPDLPDDIADDYANRQTAKTTVVAAPVTTPPEDTTNDEGDEPEADTSDNGGNDQVTGSDLLKNAVSAREALMAAWDPEYAELKASRRINI